MIPGFIITWATFPGVIVHEFGHQLLCRLTATPVHEVRYFRFGNPAGYVIHERPSSIWKGILIGFGPLIVNSTCGFLLGLIASRHVLHEGRLAFVGAGLVWLAVSVAMHSFPSTGDAKTLWQALWGEKSSVSARIVGTPLVVLIYLGAIGSVFWLDLIYGTIIGWGLPRSLVG
jgi:Putative zincin peptidase